MDEVGDEAETLTRLIDRTLILAEVNRFVVPEPDAAAVDREVAPCVRVSRPRKGSRVRSTRSA